MQTTVELVAAVAAIYGSDRKAAAHFNVSQTTFSRWHNGDDHPSEEKAVQLAELLQLDPAFVLAVIRADKAKNEAARAAWSRIAATFSKAAAVVLVVGGALAPEARAGNLTKHFLLDGPNTHWRTKRRLLGVSVQV
jgi:hypothetical protein